MAALPNDIEANIWLVDAAEVLNGKLYVLGGGWAHLSLLAEDTGVPLSVATVLSVRWQMTNRKLALTIEVFDDDGQQVTDAEGEPVVGTGELQIGRRVSLRAGAFQNVPFITPFKP